jgi:hypothetical protein
MNPGKQGGATVRFTPTQQQRLDVISLIAAGAEQETTARLLGISVDTLQRHFRSELDYATADVHAKIGKTIIQMALDGDKSMLTFVAKCRLHWRERAEVGYVDGSGRPVDPPQTTYTINIIE